MSAEHIYRARTMAIAARGALDAAGRASADPHTVAMLARIGRAISPEADTPAVAAAMLAASSAAASMYGSPAARALLIALRDAVCPSASAAAALESQAAPGADDAPPAHHGWGRA